MDIFEYGNRNAEVVLIQMADDHDLEIIENEAALIRENTGADFRLIACRVDDWNNDLSPWEAPAVFGKQSFGSGAKDTLTKVMTFCEDKSKTYYIGGYSLAGLFALWAACQKDVFQGVAAASPSVWFPGFTNYLDRQEIKSENIYLSLGDTEEKARNPVMATVGDRIREACDILRKQNKNCTLEWNKGNHFKDADLRTAKAFSWVMKQKA